MSWSYKSYTSALGDTGDYESTVLFTNGKDTFETSGDEIENEQCKQFCELLDLMPDLWSHKTDGLEFELSQIKKERFQMPEAKQIIDTAILFNDGDLDPIALSNMVGMCYFILDRLYDNGDMMIPSHKENEINKI